MHKVAIVVLADTSPADGLGRIVNAIMAAKEFKDGEDQVQLIFSGAGTKWITELANPKHMLHGAYKEVEPLIAGACGFCASAFGVAESVKGCDIKILAEYGTNMSFRRLVNEGYQVITF